MDGRRIKYLRGKFWIVVDADVLEEVLAMFQKKQIKARSSLE
jgi:hypothetical protein